MSLVAKRFGDVEPGSHFKYGYMPSEVWIKEKNGPYNARLLFDPDEDETEDIYACDERRWQIFDDSTIVSDLTATEFAWREARNAGLA